MFFYLLLNEIEIIVFTKLTKLQEFEIETLFNTKTWLSSQEKSWPVSVWTTQATGAAGALPGDNQFESREHLCSGRPGRRDALSCPTPDDTICLRSSPSTPSVSSCTFRSATKSLLLLDQKTELYKVVSLTDDQLVCRTQRPKSPKRWSRTLFKTWSCR